MKTIGIDIGGSKIRAILTDGSKILEIKQIKTPKTLAAFKKALTELITWRPGRQVGIGVAGIINGTKIISSPNIKYLRNFDFKDVVRPNGRTTSKCRIDNDARCFAKAVCPKKGVCLAITLGTGIGRAVSKNGKMLNIKKFEYPETWEKDYQSVRGGYKLKTSDELTELLSVKLSPIVLKFKPGIVIFGGGVTNRLNFLKKMTAAFNKRGIKINASLSKLGRNAVAIGAVIMLLKKR